MTEADQRPQNLDTHSRTHTESHRCNYLSNASCDFLEVNELINIREEEGEGVWGVGSGIG